MGKIGRIACIAIPMACTFIALIFLTLIGLGQTNKDSNYLSNLYFIRSNLTAAPSEFKDPRPATNLTDDAAKTDDGKIKIYNYYTVGLWNYCAGNGDKADTSDAALGQQDSAQRVVFCTPRQTRFAFDPEAAWGLTSEFSTRIGAANEKLDSALDKYQSAFSKAIGPLYILTVTSAGVTALLSISAIFSRIGSVATSFAASITSLFAFVFATVCTAAYAILAGALNTALHGQDIKFNLGPSMYIYMWLTAAASFVAMLCWSCTTCCCSGKSSSRGKKHGKGGSYQNIGGEQGYPMHTGGWSGQGAQAYGVGHGAHGAKPTTYGNAYEPYRQQH